MYNVPLVTARFLSVYTVSEFKEYVNDHSFMDCDGFGYPVKDKMVDEDITIKPSAICFIPNDATHIVWYNR